MSQSVSRGLGTINFAPPTVSAALYRDGKSIYSAPPGNISQTIVSAMAQSPNQDTSGNQSSSFLLSGQHTFAIGGHPSSLTVSGTYTMRYVTAGTTLDVTLSDPIFQTQDYLNFPGTAVDGPSPNSVTATISAGAFGSAVVHWSVGAGAVPGEYRLLILSGSPWQFSIMSLYVVPPAGGSPMVSPVPNSTLSGSGVTFTWNPFGPYGLYLLNIGSSLNATDIFSSYVQNTSQLVNGIPTDGRTIYVQLQAYFGPSYSYVYGTSSPALTIVKSHFGNFTAGQIGAIYIITVNNGGPGASSGLMTVTDTLPSGMTPTAMSGTGWSCTLATLTCTRSDSLAVGQAFPTITLALNVNTNAAVGTVTNTARLFGGGDPTPTQPSTRPPSWRPSTSPATSRSRPAPHQ